MAPLTCILKAETKSPIDIISALRIDNLVLNPKAIVISAGYTNGHKLCWEENVETHSKIRGSKRQLHQALLDFVLSTYYQNSIN